MRRIGGSAPPGLGIGVDDGARPVDEHRKLRPERDLVGTCADDRKGDGVAAGAAVGLLECGPERAFVDVGGADAVARCDVVVVPEAADHESDHESDVRETQEHPVHSPRPQHSRSPRPPLEEGDRIHARLPLS